MDKLVKELNELQLECEEAKRDVAVAEGSIATLLEQLKALGLKDEIAAEKEVKKLKAFLEKEEGDIKAEFANIKEKYGLEE